MNRQQFFIKIIIFIVIIIVIVGCIISGVIAISHSGKIAVTVEILPNDATFTVDNKPTSKGTIYIDPGVHTFIAHKDGFIDDTVTTTITKDINYIGLIPEPVSDEAKKWQTSSIQAEREAIGGRMAQMKGQAAVDTTKIVTLLPYTDIAGPFQVDYGVEPSRPNGSFLLIDNSTPDGRQNALKWIRAQGYDPTDLDIRYYEFNNPLISDGQ